MELESESFYNFFFIELEPKVVHNSKELPNTQKLTKDTMNVTQIRGGRPAEALGEPIYLYFTGPELLFGEGAIDLMPELS